eukprot:1492892-Rhodomonas_salina.1
MCPPPPEAAAHLSHRLAADALPVDADEAVVDRDLLRLCRWPPRRQRFDVHAHVRAHLEDNTHAGRLRDLSWLPPRDHRRQMPELRPPIRQDDIPAKLNC